MVEDGRGSSQRPLAPSDRYSRHVRNPARLLRSSNLCQSELDSISSSPATRNAYPSSAKEPMEMSRNRRYSRARWIALLRVVAKKCARLILSHPLRPLPPPSTVVPLRELDVTFPHGDRRRAEIDEQRAVRAEAARAADGGRAKLATLQPVACRERSALALAERRLARREPRERGDEAIQDIEPADRGEPFPERHRAMRDRRGNGIAHIHAHTDRQPLQSLAVPTALAQDARELALPQQHVVGPFEAGFEPAEEGIDRIRDGEPDAYRDHAQLGARRTEQHAEPDPPRRRVPRATVASPPRGLLFGDHHRPRPGASRGELVKQAALRHAPPPGEIDGRHPVDH